MEAVAEASQAAIARRTFFSAIEKNLLIDLVDEHKIVLENKKTG